MVRLFSFLLVDNSPPVALTQWSEVKGNLKLNEFKTFHTVSELNFIPPSYESYVPRPMSERDNWGARAIYP